MFAICTHSAPDTVFDPALPHRVPGNSTRFTTDIRTTACSFALIAFLCAQGCSLSPAGTALEQEKLHLAGKLYEPKFEERVLPELPETPTWRDVLQRSFLANGDIEASYFNWKAAVERIDIASAYPNSDVSLGFDYMFSSERMKAFDRSTFTAGFDSAMNLSLPIKVEQAGKVALDEARVAGETFRVAKFELQRKVLRAWADYMLQERTIALRSEDVVLRRVLAEAAVSGASAGRRVRDVKAAHIDLQTTESELLDLRGEHDQTRALLNALMSRPPNAPLDAPVIASPVRVLPDDDAVMLKAAADTFPEVAAMAREVEGRTDALELARMRWIPDIGPTFGFAGSISQSIGAMITLPTTVTAIRGRIREAESQLRASQAILRQRSSDRIGEYLSLLIMFRNAQRQGELFEKTILPAARRLSDDDLRAYESGAATFAEVIESRRLLLNIHELIATAHAEMDKSVVEIECCLGIDIETLSPANESTRVPTAVSSDASVPQAQTTKENGHVH